MPAIVGVPASDGTIDCPHYWDDPEEALSFLDDMNAAQIRWNGTTPWRFCDVKPVAHRALRGRRERKDNVPVERSRNDQGRYVAHALS